MITGQSISNLNGHLYLSFSTKRNAIDTTILNERQIFVPFGSVADYRRSFPTKLQLYFPTESQQMKNHMVEKNLPSGINNGVSSDGNRFNFHPNRLYRNPGSSNCANDLPPVGFGHGGVPIHPNYHAFFCSCFYEDFHTFNDKRLKQAELYKNYTEDYET
uniref:Uncharacterized protein n=1 Tax=Romanomermis culicivorax TaxID=13658 RepID=A0A915HE36_ROMCU